MITLFYLFASIAVVAAAGSVLFKNTLYNVLSLIVVFFNVGGILLLTGAEFLALMFLIVYVGAVAVLFLFVVMMLDSTNNNLSDNKTTKHTTVASGLAALVFAVEMIVVARVWVANPKTHFNAAVSDLSNTEALGMLLYTHYFYVFQAAGLILLVSIIGAIVLTMNKKNPGHKKQSVSLQLQRSKESTLVIKRVNFKAGVNTEDFVQGLPNNVGKSFPHKNSNEDNQSID